MVNLKEELNSSQVVFLVGGAVSLLVGSILEALGVETEVEVGAESNAPKLLNVLMANVQLLKCVIKIKVWRKKIKFVIICHFPF